MKCIRDYGIGMAVDIEGNCRFYDLFRFKKMAKISPLQARLDEYKVTSNSFRLMGINTCVEMTQDAFMAVIQTPKISKIDTPEGEEKPAT